MKTYRGYTDGDGTTGGPNGPVAVYANGREPDRLRHLIVHSPGGMAWGYGGSGAADLALSILADYLGEADTIPPHGRYDPAIAEQIQDTAAWTLHQDFKWAFVARFAQDRGWTLSEAEIAAWVAPRLPAVLSVRAERRALGLIGHRVQLDDGRRADVMDIDGAGEDVGLVVIVPDADDWQRIAPARVARDLGPMPDDEEDRTAGTPPESGRPETPPYPSWLDARTAWMADKLQPRRYAFPCPGCGCLVEASTGEMPTLSARGGLCPACHAAEEAMYRRATPDDFLHGG